MNLPKLLHINNTAIVVGVAGSPQPTWINPDDISNIIVTCGRTPILEIRLRSEPDRTIRVARAEATQLLEQLKKPRK